LGTVVFVCHPKPCGRWRSGGSRFQVSPDKNVCETSSPQKKAGRGGVAVIPAMAGNVNRIMVYVALGNN
jgi:hypothetical protein